MTLKIDQERSSDITKRKTGDWNFSRRRRREWDRK